MLILNIANIYRSVTSHTQMRNAYKYVIHTHSKLMFRVWT